MNIQVGGVLNHERRLIIVQYIKGWFAKYRGPILRSLALLLAGSCVLSAQYGETNARFQAFVSKKGVAIEQKLNSSIPLDLVFTDETNHAVPLRTYFGR